MAKTLIGTVSSVAADKTITISVSTRKTHPIYKKQYSVSKKFMAHDEENACKVGDKVSIVETRPISARKRFKLEKILERAVLTQDDLKALDTEDEKPAEKLENEDKKTTPANGVKKSKEKTPGTEEKAE